MNESKSGRKQAPARSVEGRQQQMTALAMDLAEKRLRDGTASNQLLCHFLKYATVEAELEKEKIQSDVQLQKAKIESLKSQKSTEELYANAIAALKKYQGNNDEEEDYYDKVLL